MSDCAGGGEGGREGGGELLEPEKRKHPTVKNLYVAERGEEE